MFGYTNNSGNSVKLRTIVGGEPVDVEVSPGSSTNFTEEQAANGINIVGESGAGEPAGEQS